MVTIATENDFDRITTKAAKTTLHFAKCISVDLEVQCRLKQSDAQIAAGIASLAGAVALIAIAMGKAVPSDQQSADLASRIMDDMRTNLTDA